MTGVTVMVLSCDYLNILENQFIIENISSEEFGIRYSLSSIKNVGIDAIKNIVQMC